MTKSRLFLSMPIVYHGEIGFSPQSHRRHRGTFFCLSGDDDKQKPSIPLSAGISGRRPELFMENRHLSILHKNFFPARSASERGKRLGGEYVPITRSITAKVFRIKAKVLNLVNGKIKGASQCQQP